MYNKPLVFVSYTTRGNKINEAILSLIKLRFNRLSHTINTYIDRIDNHSSTSYQNHVIGKLKSATVVLVLDRPDAKSSKWVVGEIKCAKKNDIPIINIPLKDIFNFISIRSIQELQNHWITKQICKEIEKASTKKEHQVIAKNHSLQNESSPSASYSSKEESLPLDSETAEYKEAS